VTIAVAVKVHDGLVLAADSASTMVSLDPTAGSQVAVNIYNNANKVANLKKGFPIGVVTWGSGSMGPASVSTLAKDLRKRFSGDDQDHSEWELRPNSYTMEGVARMLREFMYEEHYVPEFAGSPVKPALSFLMGGYSPSSPLAEVYHVEIEEGGACGEPKLISGSDDAEPMVYCEGQPRRARKGPSRKPIPVQNLVNVVAKESEGAKVAMQPINSVKCDRVVRLARDKGEVCPWCRSADELTCKPTVNLVADGEATAYLYCANVAVYHPTGEGAFRPFVLSPWEARNIGIVVRS
jgi:hypothetical protein